MLTFGICWTLVCLVILPYSTYGEEPPIVQEGGIACFTDSETGIINATMIVYKREADSIRTIFTDPELTYGIFDEGCLWTGDGSDDNPFRAEVYINAETDEAAVDSPDCGHQVIDPVKNKYRWTAFVQAEINFAKLGDACFIFECTALPDRIETSVNLTSPGFFEVPTDMGSLSFGFYNPGLSPSTNLVLNVGDDFRLSLMYQPFNPSGSEMAFWGAHCRELYAVPDLSDLSFRRIDLIDNDGCPADVFMNMNQEMIGTYPETNTVYTSRGGVMSAIKYDKSALYPTFEGDMVYFVCEAELCWIPNDPNCINRCEESNLKKRKKRSLNSDYHLVASIRIRDPHDTNNDDKEDDKTSGKEGGKEAQNYLIPVLTAVGGFLLFLIVGIVLTLICCRERAAGYYHRHQNASVSSDGSNRSACHSKGSQFSEKRSYGYSNKEFRY
ncbi:hypothetical protein ACF0H5_004781 [Mactra antiquata]